MTSIDPAGLLLSLIVFVVLGGAAVIHIYRPRRPR